MNANTRIPVTQMQRTRYEEIGVIQFFTYHVEFLALAVGATATGTFTIDNDSSWEWASSCYFADIALAAQTDGTRVIPLVDVQMTDSGQGRQMSSAPLPVSCLFGTAEDPFILPYPRIFTPKSTVSIVVTNFSAGSIYNLYLDFHGQKLFPRTNR